MTEDQTKKFMRRDGRVMAVIRPSDPKRAIAAAFQCTSQADMNNILKDPEQIYTFAGIASKHTEELLDPTTGDVVGKLEPGDSFVPWEQIKALFPAGEA